MQLFNRKKSNILHQEYEERIMHLQLQREISKNTILRIRSDMQELIDRATCADDLDQRILSMDYEEKKATLATETEHFEDLNKLIRQLRSAVLANERCKAFEQIASVSDCIDTYAVLKAEDTVDIRRTLMKEEFDSLDELLIQDGKKVWSIEENSEFARLVQEAAKRKKAVEQGGSTDEGETAAITDE